jgi:hypothetical protein
LPSDDSSNLILVTRSGSTIPPDGPTAQPELLKKIKIINQQPQIEQKTQK